MHAGIFLTEQSQQTFLFMISSVLNAKNGMTKRHSYRFSVCPDFVLIILRTENRVPGICQYVRIFERQNRRYSMCTLEVYFVKYGLAFLLSYSVGDYK